MLGDEAGLHSTEKAMLTNELILWSIHEARKEREMNVFGRGVSL